MNTPRSALQVLHLRVLLWAAVSIWALSASTRADVVYSGYQDIAVPLNFDGLYLNVVTGAMSSSQPVTWNSGPWINPFFGGIYLVNDDLLRPLITDAGQAVNLSPGSLIDGSSLFAAGEGGSLTHVGTAADQFHIGTAGFLGFEYEAAPGGVTHFGWLSLTVDNTGAGTINGWALDDSASSILAGNVVQSAPQAGAQSVTLTAGLSQPFTLGSALTDSGGNINHVIKSGQGTVTLNSPQTYTGGTTVSSGTLNVINTSGSATGSGGIQVDAGAVLSGTGLITAATGNIVVDGTLSIGSTASPVAGTLQVGTSPGNQLTLGSSGAMHFNLFSGAGSGNNTSTLGANDLLVLSGDLSLTPGASLIIDDPNHMTGWAIGDQWKIWDVTHAGTLTGRFDLGSIIAPYLNSTDMAWSFDSSSGILSIVAPEPGRVLLLLIGMSGLLLQRRRRN